MVVFESAILAQKQAGADPFLHPSFHSSKLCPSRSSFVEPYDTISGNTIEKNIADKRLTRGRKWWGMDQRHGGNFCSPLCVRYDTEDKYQNKATKYNWEMNLKKTRQSAEKRKEGKMYGNKIVPNPEWTLKLLINIQYVASCSVSSLQLDKLEINCIIYY